MTILTIKNLTPPEKYTISDLSDGDFFLYPADKNCLCVKCNIFHATGYFALCMEAHDVKFGKVFEFNSDEEVIPICNVELTLL